MGRIIPNVLTFNICIARQLWKNKFPRVLRCWTGVRMFFGYFWKKRQKNVDKSPHFLQILFYYQEDLKSRLRREKKIYFSQIFDPELRRVVR